MKRFVKNLEFLRTKNCEKQKEIWYYFSWDNRQKMQKARLKSITLTGFFASFCLCAKMIKMEYNSCFIYIEMIKLGYTKRRKRGTIWRM